MKPDTIIDIDKLTEYARKKLPDNIDDWTDQEWLLCTTLQIAINNMIIRDINPFGKDAI